MIDCSDMYWHFAANFEMNLKFIAGIIDYHNHVSTRVMQWLLCEGVKCLALVHVWWSLFQDNFALLSFHGNSQFLNPYLAEEICVHLSQNHKNFDNLWNLVYFSFVAKFTKLLGNNVQGQWIMQCCFRRQVIYSVHNSINVSQTGKLVCCREGYWKEICHRVQEWSVTVINGEIKMG